MAAGLTSQEPWRPLWGAQTLFLKSPFFETLLSGTRGGGKSEVLLVDFAQHCGQGFGPGWRGVIFRENYPQLTDLIATSKRLFYRMGARFNASNHTWTWPGGEMLMLRYMQDISDYRQLHGFSCPFIGWDELTSWRNDDCYEMMKTVCRATTPGMPRKIRATTNPLGVGMQWVKMRFIDPAPYGVPIETKVKMPDGTTQVLKRVTIFSSIWENTYLTENDPNYIAALTAITDPAKKAAWLLGDWSGTSGGMFDDVWKEHIHVVHPFAIPHNWRVDRSFDWGDSAPFATLWWAESNGETVMTNKGPQTYPRGTMFLIAEWYGWNGVKPNVGCRMLASDIAKGIAQREAAMFKQRVVKRGPADTQIFTPSGVESHASIADEMAKHGILWTEADKAKGSRVLGWQKLRELLSGSLKQPMEMPGLFIFSTCRQTIRTFPGLRRDEKNVEDIDKQEEDHIADAMRYRVFTRIRRASTGQFLV